MITNVPQRPDSSETIKFTEILWKSCFLGYLCFLRETLDKLRFASRCRIRLPNKLIFTMDVEWDCLTNWHHRCLAKNLWTSNIIRGHLQKLTDLLQKNYAWLQKTYDSAYAPQMPCKKVMSLEHHSQPLVRKYWSVAELLCLLAGSVCRERDNTKHKKNTTFCNESNYKYFIIFL